MFPLKQKKLGGYSFMQPTFYGTPHKGTDYVAKYDNYYAPFTGVATSGVTDGGGRYWQLIRPNGDVLIARHLDKVLKIGQVKEGDLVAITGNTGKYTTGPHLHQEVKINGVYTDPEKYNWTTMVKLPITIVANKNVWTTLQDQLNKLSEWSNTYSKGQIQTTFDVVHTDFSDVPKMPWQGTQAVDVNWYRDHITHLATGKATLLLLNPEQWGISGWGTMTYGDPGKPVRMEVEAIENEMNGDVTVFVARAFHEICHMLFFLTGQPDRTHELLLVPEDRKAELLALIDYGKLEAGLNNIKTQEKIKIRSIGWTDTEKGIYFPFPNMATMKKVLDTLEANFPNYELDPKERNLGKRPW